MGLIVAALLAQANVPDALKRDGWRAVEHYAAQGDAVLAALKEAARSSDRDVAFYAAAALASIDLREAIAPLATTEAMEGRSADVAAALFKSAHLKLAPDGLADRVVKLPAGLGFADAVDRLGRELDVEFIERGEEYRHGGPRGKGPRFTSGRIMATLSNWSRSTFVATTGVRTSYLSLMGNMTGYGRFRTPLLDSDLRVLDAADAQGNDLRKNDLRKDDPSLHAFDTACGGDFTLHLADATTVARLRLVAVFKFERKREDVTIDKILDAKNVVKKAGDVTITLKRVAAEPSGYRVEFRLAGMPREARLESEHYRVLDGEGRAWNVGGYSFGGSGADGRYELSLGNGAGAGPPDKLILSLITETTRREVYFEFRDVTLK